jgi:hypothetical protein
MLIESKLKREGGTLVTLGEEEYHFQDNGKGNHVCEVKDEAHIAKFLSIKEGYFEHGKKPAKEPVVIPVDDKGEVKDPEQWTNKQLNDWAKEQGLNPANKGSLLDYAESKGIIGIDENLNPANIIRIIAKGLVR